MLTLILAESALETVPENLWKHPAVKTHARKRDKKPNWLILDRSYHHRAMLQLPNNEKRGRPDIVHFALLEALGSPLNKEGLLKVYVHTINDYVIDVDSKVRLPRNYNRFIGLMEQLFQQGQVPPKSRNPLLTLKKKTLPSLINEIKPDYTIIFTKKGRMQTLENAISKIADKERPTIIVGGFPHGNFMKETLKLADEKVCIDPETLEAWTVTARAIYEYEKAKSTQKKRTLRKLDEQGVNGER